METVGEDTNGVRLAKLDIIMKELSNTIKRIDESNHNVKIQIDAIQDGISKIEEPQTEIKDTILKVKNNIFLLENI
jgi:peptidoglycan hydrolase CwlO-like protein